MNVISFRDPRKYDIYVSRPVASILAGISSVKNLIRFYLIVSLLVCRSSDVTLCLRLTCIFVVITLIIIAVMASIALNTRSKTSIHNTNNYDISTAKSSSKIIQLLLIKI